MQISTELPLLYQDEHLVAVYKPSGLLVHRSPIDKRETVFALQLVRDQVGQYVFPVHRLDKPTSGVLMFALSSEVANMMMLKFQAGEVRKHYLAVVRGRLTGNGCVEYALQGEGQLGVSVLQAEFCEVVIKSIGVCCGLQLCLQLLVQGLINLHKSLHSSSRLVKVSILQENN